MSTSEPCRFAVVVPVFNTAERYFAACLDSIRRAAEHHGLGNVEVAVVDDASRPQPARAYRRIIDTERSHGLTVHHHAFGRHAGIAAAREHGVRSTGNEWIVLVDSDDLISPLTFSVLNNRLDTGDILAYTAHRKLTEDLSTTVEIRRKSRYQDLLRREAGTARDPFLHFTFLIHMHVIARRAFEAVGGFDRRISYGDEIDFHLRLTERYPGDRFRYIDEVLYLYRENSGGVCADAGHYRELITNIERVLLRHYIRRGGTALRCSRSGKEPDRAVRYEYA